MACVRWIALPPATPDYPCERILDQTASLVWSDESFPLSNTVCYTVRVL